MLRLGVFFQAEDGIRDLVRSRGLGDVYKRQDGEPADPVCQVDHGLHLPLAGSEVPGSGVRGVGGCLLYTSDAADERSSVDLGGRRIIKKKIVTLSSHRRILRYTDLRT